MCFNIGEIDVLHSAGGLVVGMRVFYWLSHILTWPPPMH